MKHVSYGFRDVFDECHFKSGLEKIDGGLIIFQGLCVVSERGGLGPSYNNTKIISRLNLRNKELIQLEKKR